MRLLWRPSSDAIDAIIRTELIMAMTPRVPAPYWRVRKMLAIRPSPTANSFAMRDRNDPFTMKRRLEFVLMNFNVFVMERWVFVSVNEVPTNRRMIIEKSASEKNSPFATVWVASYLCVTVRPGVCEVG